MQFIGCAFILHGLGQSCNQNIALSHDTCSLSQYGLLTGQNNSHIFPLGKKPLITKKTNERYTAQIILLGDFMLMKASFSGASVLRQALRSAVDGSTLSRQEIAARAGVSRRTLYELLEGSGDPRLSTLEAVAHVLGMDLFAAPKAVRSLHLSSPANEQMSSHSRVRRLLENSMRSGVAS